MNHAKFTSHEAPARGREGRRGKVLSPRGISLSSVHTLCDADFAFDTVSPSRHRSDRGGGGGGGI
ncbi:hypothetical protein K0M31_009334 [Melipona bicolor]|uniref:Uncharacterized protein n=1 Tax=Melipona bicolor TaxID=60889 RepID=A0AA40KJT6_9HYME|nr:hypothetical protein K0M31_009334 [Melipona bicolor]